MQETIEKTQAQHNADVVLTVVKYAFNATLDEFHKDFEYVLGSSLMGGYVEEKFRSMRDNFTYFYGNLDSEAQVRFVEAALRHYGK